MSCESKREEGSFEIIDWFYTLDIADKLEKFDIFLLCFKENLSELTLSCFNLLGTFLRNY